MAGVYINKHFVPFASLREDAENARQGNVGLLNNASMAAAIIALLDYIQEVADVATQEENEAFEYARRQPDWSDEASNNN